MFWTVRLVAKLSLINPQAAPPGFRKSFCRSVKTRAVRRCSITIPGIGRVIVRSFRESRNMYIQLSKQENLRSETTLDCKLVQRPDPRIAQQLMGLTLRRSPR